MSPYRGGRKFVVLIARRSIEYRNQTSGGEGYKIPVKLGGKEKLRDTVYRAMK